MRGLFLAGLCALVAAQNAALFGFSGTFNSNGGTLTTISLDTSSGACYNDSTSADTFYTTFNYTFNSSGVRALFAANIDFVAVSLANATFDVLDLCRGGSVMPLLSSDSGPFDYTTYQYGGWFAAATYTFVIGSSSSGPFVGEIWDGSYNGQTTIGGTVNKSWDFFYSSSGSCSQYGDLALYDTQAVRVNNSGYYNVYLTFARNLALGVDYQTPYPSPSYAILMGDYTQIDLSNATCASIGSNYVFADNDGDNFNLQSFRVWLNTNQTYTFVVSGGYQYSSDNFYYGHYSLAVTPSRNYQYQNATLFSRPDYYSCTAYTDSQTACVAYETPNIPQPFGYTTLTVPAQSQFFIWLSQYTAAGAYNDQEFFLYNEFNTNLATCGTLSTHCWDAEDSIDGTIYASGSNTDFTIISTPYSDNEFGVEAAFGLYMLSGPQLGYVASTNAPTSPTNGMTPTSPTIAMTPTSPTNSAAPTKVGTTLAPSKTGSTLAPGTTTTKAPSSQVSGVAWFSPCLVTVVSLIAFWA